MKSVSSHWRHQWLARLLRGRRSGFTLLELLVAMLIGSLIISLLMQLVLELLQTERRETALDSTQRDMQRAMAYIEADVREAIHVYSTPGTAPAIASVQGALPNSADIENNVVLAFWRIDPIEGSNIPTNCAGFATPVLRQECEVLQVRQSQYSLVVYQILPNGNHPTWQGQARIARFHFPKYSNPANLTQNVGFVEPIDRARPNLTFDTWAATQQPTVRSAILVDYVDTPSNTTNIAADTLACRPGMLRSPANTNASTSFFACVRNATNVDGDSLNQDVEIVLRGNFEPFGGGASARGTSEASTLPTLRTGVLVRGILDKQ